MILYSLRADYLLAYYNRPKLTYIYRTHTYIGKFYSNFGDKNYIIRMQLHINFIKNSNFNAILVNTDVIHMPGRL